MSKQEKVAKAPYAAPKLNVYGGFSQLTAAGSAGVPEGMATNNMNRLA